MKKQAIISSLDALEQGASKSVVVRHLKEQAHIQVKKNITRQELKEGLRERVGKSREMKDGLYIVSTSYFCAGFIIKHGKIERCAPILRRKFNY